MTVFEKIRSMADVVHTHGSYSFSFEADLGREDITVGRITGSRTPTDGVEWLRSYLDHGEWRPEEVIPVDLLVDYVAWMLDYQESREREWEARH